MNGDEAATAAERRSDLGWDLLLLRRHMAGASPTGGGDSVAALCARITQAVQARTDDELAAFGLPAWVWRWDRGESLGEVVLELADGEGASDVAVDDALSLVYALQRAESRGQAPVEAPSDEPGAPGRDHIDVVVAEGEDRTIRLMLPVRSAPRGTAQDAGQEVVKVAETEVRELLSGLEAPFACRFAIDSEGLTCIDPTMTLPIALRLLQENAGMDAEPVVAVGEAEGSGFRPLTDAEVRSRQEALVGDSAHARLLVPSEEGWSVLHGDGKRLDVVDPERSLAGAAEAVWGRRWADWSRQRRENILQRLGWSRVDDFDESRLPVPLTDVTQVDQLAAIFRRRNRATAILGGPRSSGKTATGRLLARRLSENWQVITIASDTGRLSNADDLRRVVGAAVELLERSSRPRLVILDNIEPTTELDETSMDDVLPRAAGSSSERVPTSLLALLRYDVNATEYKSDTLPIVRAVAGRNSAMKFAQELVKGNPELAGAKRYLTDIVRHNHTDMRRLVHALKRAAPEESDSTSVSDTVPVLGELGDDEAAALAQLAAVSLLGSEVDAGNLWPLTEERLPEVGAEQSRAGHWRIPGIDACFTVLRQHRCPSDQRSFNEVMAELAAPEVVRSLAQPSASERATAFLRRARIANESACRRLMARSDVDFAFQDWLAAQDATVVAELILSAESVFSAAQLSRLDEFLFDSDRLQDIRHNRAGRILTVLRAIYRFRYRCSNESFEHCVVPLREAVEHVLESGGGNTTDLFRIIDLLSRFHHEEFDRTVALLGGSVLRDLDPTELRDYLTVQRTAVLMRRAARSADVFAADPGAEPSVREILEHKPNPRHGLPLLIAWLGVRLELDHLEDDWSETWRKYGGAMRASVRHSDVNELRLVLNELHKQHQAFCVRMLNELNHACRLSSQLRTLIDRHSLPAESAMLIGTLANRHAKIAFELLYETKEGRPVAVNEQLAETMAELINDTGDNKGAGMLLGNSFIIDDWCGRPAEGFANLLAANLGEEWFIEQVEDDPRMSVVGHLVGKMWLAGPEFRDAVLESVRIRIATETNRSLRPWGPQLALTIAEDHTLGTGFLADLRDGIDDTRFLEGMGEAGTSAGRVFFHRLGRALYRDLPSRFLADFEAGTLDRPVLDSSPTTATECLSEMAATIRAAGVPHPGREMLASLPPAVNDRLFTNLGKRSSAEEIASTLRKLNRMSPEFARTVVARLTEPPSQSSAHGVIGSRVRQAMLTGSHGAADLMEAVEFITPGKGEELLHEARQRGHWEVFTRHVQHMQHPTEQWIIAKRLHRAGLRFEWSGNAWMQRVWDARKSYINTVTGPRVLTDTLRMFALWRKEWAEEAAQFIAVDRLVERIADGTQPDLTAVPRLLDTLERFGAEDGVDRLVDALFAFPLDELTRRLGLHQASRLAQWLLGWDRERAEAMAGAQSRRIEEALHRPVVLDEPTHWIELGWAASVVRRTGMVDSLPLADPVVPCDARAMPVECAWAAAWLPSQEWTGAALEAAFSVLDTAELQSPSARAYILAAASMTGRSADLVQAPGDWGAACNASPSHRVLFEWLAETDSVVRVLLSQDTDDVEGELTDEADLVPPIVG